MSNITVYRRVSYVRKDGKAPICLMMFIGGKKLEINTKVLVEEYHWDDIKKIVKPSHSHASDYNLIISDAVGRSNRIFIKYRLLNRTITLTQFKAEYKNPSLGMDFYEWMLKEILDRKGTIANHTINNHKTVLSNLIEFKSELTFSEINDEFLDGFVKFIQKKHNINIGTQYDKIKVLKAYVNIAHKRGMIERNPFLNFRMKKAKSNPVCLDSDELKKFIEMYRKDPDITQSQRKVLRRFLFGCMTSLRYGDILSLTHDQIISDIIVKHPSKTRSINRELVQIPLCKSAKKLIKDENPVRISGLVFNPITEQTVNKYMKVLAKKKSIKKNITTHVARHTFATEFLKHNPGDIATLQKLMGHSKIEQTMIYVHIDLATKISRMKAFDSYIR